MCDCKSFPGRSAVKESTCNAGVPVQFWGQEVPLEKGYATHSSILGLPWDSNGKESTCNTGDLGSIPGLRRSPGEGHSNPLQYSCLKNPHGQSLVSYSPCGLQRVGHDWVTKHTHTSVSPKHVSPFYRVIPALNPCQ